MPRNAMTVTLALANTNYQLAALIKAIDPNTRRSFNEISLQAVIGNAGTVLLGDASMGAADFGDELTAGTRVKYGPDGMSIRSTENIYLRSASAGVKVAFIGKE